MTRKKKKKVSCLTELFDEIGIVISGACENGGVARESIALPRLLPSSGRGSVAQQKSSHFLKAS